MRAPKTDNTGSRKAIQSTARRPEALAEVTQEVTMEECLELIRDLKEEFRYLERRIHSLEVNC